MRAKNTAPSVETVDRWGELFEELFDFSGLVEKMANPKAYDGDEEDVFCSAIESLKIAALNKLLSAKFTYSVSSYTSSTIASFVNETVSGFLTADTFSTMGMFMRSALGSFGLAVASSHEPGSVVLAACGQPMCFSIDPEVNCMVYGSEVNAISVPIQEHGPSLRYRYDLNDRYDRDTRVAWIHSVAAPARGMADHARTCEPAAG